MVRFHGRNRENWEARGISAAERFRYLYDGAGAGEWVPRIGEVSAQASETHVLFNNCYSDFGVRNAADLVQQLELADLQ